MPIKDLSENVRLPRLGKIHLGIRHPEKGYPMKTDYFVLPGDHSDYQKLVDAFGEKPKELRVLIPVEDEEVWATQYYKAYNQTYGLVCKGDGEIAIRMVNVKTGRIADKESTGTMTMTEIPCTGKSCSEYQTKKCKEMMNLRFILPEVPGLGVWQIDTGSINSILNINSCAKVIKRAFGRTSLIPLKLTLEPAQVNNPETGKKQTVYVLHLRTNVTMAQLADSAREQAKAFLLEAPDLEAAYEVQVDRDMELWDNSMPPPSVQGKTAVADGRPEPGLKTPPDAPQEATGSTKGERRVDASPESPIDLGWFKENLGTLQGKGLKMWSDVNFVKLSNAMTGQNAKTTSEAVMYLSPAQVREVTRKIQDALELS